jgi:DNA polymerase III epsilon subunit-like protein
MQLPYIIDVEASGFGRGSYPIEVGVARPDGTTSARLITPPPGWNHWSSEAQLIHGITREQLLDEGQAVSEVADWLNQELRGLTVYSDSWGFDSSWIALLFDEAGRLQMFRVETLNKLLTEAQLTHWADTKHEVLEALRLVRHRAADDALMLHLTLQRVLKC